MKKWGQPPAKQRNFVGLAWDDRSQSPFFHKLSRVREIGHAGLEQRESAKAGERHETCHPLENRGSQPVGTCAVLNCKTIVGRARAKVKSSTHPKRRVQNRKPWALPKKRCLELSSLNKCGSLSTSKFQTPFFWAKPKPIRFYLTSK